MVNLAGVLSEGVNGRFGVQADLWRGGKGT
jgi:hypothetical protein